VPDNQLNARFLSKPDQILAIERIRKNQQGVGNKHYKMYQLREALADPLSWMFFFYSLVANIPNGKLDLRKQKEYPQWQLTCTTGGISNFFSQLIVSFGYTPEQSLLYGTPGGAIEIISIMTWAWLTQIYPNQRISIACAWLCVAILGIVLIVALPLHANGGRLAGYYLTQASPVPFVCLLSLIATNVAGYTKKTTVAAM
jgi:ACS family allantoate permease-like MFS transporter